MKEKINQYIKTWEQRCYSDGIPDEAPIEIFDKVPSYKRICIAILKNDTHLTSLGYTAPESKYYGMLKRIEIESRKRKKGDQLNLFKDGF
jgi:predicted phosphoadenosine phosphosulfate sulfurtransferase